MYFKTCKTKVGYNQQDKVKKKTRNSRGTCFAPCASVRVWLCVEGPYAQLSQRGNKTNVKLLLHSCVSLFRQIMILFLNSQLPMDMNFIFVKCPFHQPSPLNQSIEKYCSVVSGLKKYHFTVLKQQWTKFNQNIHLVFEAQTEIKHEDVARINGTQQQQHCSSQNTIHNC